MRAIKMAVVAAVCGAAAGGASADVVDIPASRDNTLYESSTGATSNALGGGIFIGKTAFGQVRRALIRFDVVGVIPAGSTVTGVTLALAMNQTISFDHPASLHRALTDWGEGTSQATGQGGTGAPATTGDATWLHTFRPTGFWSAPGGTSAGASPDFAAAASATIIVGDAFMHYTWGPTPGMAADVQGWLNAPASNFGWFLLGDETASTTAKRFGSREATVPAERPVLRVTYTPPGGPVCYANCDGSTVPPVLNVNDFVCFQTRYAAGDSRANCDGSTTPPALNVNDFICFQTAFAAGCP